MFIPDLAEKVDAVSARKKCRSDRVNGRIAPALVVEATLVIEVLKVRRVGLSSVKVQIRNLKIVIKHAQVVFGTTVVGDEVHRVIWHDVFGVLVYEIFHSGPQ